jgi:hypothetical protein
VSKTYSVLANLALINTTFLSVFGGPKAKARDEVHDEEDNAGTEERVDEAGDAVRELVGELDVVAVEPTTGDLGEAVKMGNVIPVVAYSQFWTNLQFGEGGECTLQRRRSKCFQQYRPFRARRTRQGSHQHG